jgi:hypothetical protein
MDALREASENDFKDIERFGRHASVFFYQTMADISEPTRTVIRLMFHDVPKVLCFLPPVPARHELCQ